MILYKIKSFLIYSKILYQKQRFKENGCEVMCQHFVEPIAHIENNYKDKFGIPRQSNLVKSNISTIIFTQKYRDENSLRGLDGYSHIWLIWLCDKAQNSDAFSPTVRPPRLGGNKRMGVFSTRSPFHPNRLGLSCVELISIEKTSDYGVVLKVRGDDLLSGTPIIDIKPYLPFSDSYPNAKYGFAEDVFGEKLDVKFSKETSFLPIDIKNALIEILSQDPRPAYHNYKDRIYNMDYGCYKISFSVKDGIVTVLTSKSTETEADL